MSHSISCVLLIPGEYKASINALANSLGYGPDYLSVLLIKPDNAEWFGCHTWCVQTFLDQLSDPSHAGEALDALVVSAIPGSTPLDNWSKSLLDNDLTIKIPDQGDFLCRDRS